MTRTLDIIIRFGTLAFVFFIPWQARLILSEGAINGQYWEYGTRSLYATEILLLLVLLAVVAKGGACALSARPRFALKRLASPAGALLLFAAWAGLSVFWSIDRHVALEHWLVIVSGAAVFLILASGAVPFRQLSWAIILSGSIQAILAFVQFRTQEVIGSTWLGMAYQHASILGASVVETDAMRLLRGYGSFPHPNMLGGWLVLGLALAVKEAMRRGRQEPVLNLIQEASTPLSYIPIALMSVGLAVTFSRSAWLAFVAGLAVLIAAMWSGVDGEAGLDASVQKKASPPLRKVGAALLVIALFVGVLVFSYPEPFQERVFGGGRLEAKSTQERSAGISEALQIIKQHPIAGVGIGNYGLAVHRDIDTAKPAYYYQPVHNVPLLILAELGAVGLILIIVLVLSLRALVLKGEAILLATYGERSEKVPFFTSEPRSLYVPISSRNSLMSGAVFLLPLITIALFDHYPWSLYGGVMISAVYAGLCCLAIKSKHNHA